MHNHQRLSTTSADVSVAEKMSETEAYCLQFWTQRERRRMNLRRQMDRVANKFESDISVSPTSRRPVGGLCPIALRCVLFFSLDKGFVT